MSKTIPKYRPYLSIEAMTRILSYLPALKDEIDAEIQKSLELTLFRAGRPYTKPAYVATPLPTMQEKLGITDEELDDEFQRLQKELGVSNDPIS